MLALKFVHGVLCSSSMILYTQVSMIKVYPCAQILSYVRKKGCLGTRLDIMMCRVKAVRAVRHQACHS